MNLTIVKSAQFLNDFERQYRWYESKGGAELSIRYLVAVDLTLQFLGREPGLGTVRKFPQPELKGIRSFSVSKPFNVHLVFYRIKQSEVEIIRVMYGGRDLQRRLLQKPNDED